MNHADISDRLTIQLAFKASYGRWGWVWQVLIDGTVKFTGTANTATEAAATALNCFILLGNDAA